MLNVLIQLLQHSQPPPQPPVLHAPQPHVPQPPLDFSWTSQPPANRIIATPSWTAMFTDPPPPLSHSGTTTNGLYHPSFSPPPAPASATSNGSSAHVTSSFPFSSGPTNAFSSVSSTHFALPPTTTLFTDHQAALAAAPSAFYSSYGLYQPVQGPYARFLTPSPEPSVLGDFELELELENLAAANAAANGGGGAWDEGKVKAENGEGGDGTEDPFAGMTMPPSRAVSPKQAGGGGGGYDPGAGMPNGAYGMYGQSMPHHQQQQQQPQHGQYESYEQSGYGGVGGEPSTSFHHHNHGNGAALPDWTTMTTQHAVDELMGDEGASGGKGNNKGKGKASAKPRKPRGKKAAAAAALAASATVAPVPTAAAAITAAEKAAASKKNRNPHATQLPGSAGGKKREVGEGGEGPVCTHCGSVTTPLWRRGPEDELLCNA